MAPALPPAMAPSKDSEVSDGLKRDSDLWLKGRQIFEARMRQEKKYAGALDDFLENGSTVEAARDQCAQAKDKVEKQYNKGYVTILGHKVFPKAVFGKVMENLHYAIDLGNWLVQGAPETVGLAWMAIRILVGTVQQDYAISQYCIIACADLTTILIRCKSKVKTFYESKRGKVTEMEEQLFQRLPEIYAEILTFSFWVRRHFRKHNFGRFVPLISIDKFTPKMEDIKKLEIEVTKDAEEVFHAKSVAFQDRADDKLTSMDAKADRILAELKTQAPPPKKTFQELVKEEYEDNKKKFNIIMTQDTYESHLAEKGEETLEWLTEDNPYTTWCNTEDTLLLWLSGKEGSGKSVLTAQIIETVEADAKENDYCVVHYFCDGHDEATADRVRAVFVLGMYDYAASKSNTDLLAKCNDAFRDAAVGKKAKGSGSQESKKLDWDLDDVFEKLFGILETKIYMIIDAVDQCDEDEQFKLFESMSRYINFSDQDIKILVSSRPEIDPPMEYSFERLELSKFNEQDIQQATTKAVEKLPGFSDEERKQAVDAIVERAEGVFRYVSVGIDFLKQPWQRPLSKRLEQLPVGLGASYFEDLRQLDPNYTDLFRTALKWTTIATQVPYLQEIMDDYKRTYMVADPDRPPYILQEDDENENAAATQLRKAAASFLTVSPTKQRTVTFTNRSIKQFFTTRDNFPTHQAHSPDALCAHCRKAIDVDPSYFIDDKTGHLQLAITCLQHLNSPMFQYNHMDIEYDTDSSESDNESEDSPDEESKDTPESDHHSNASNEISAELEDHDHNKEEVQSSNHSEPSKDDPEQQQQAPIAADDDAGEIVGDADATHSDAHEDADTNRKEVAADEEGAKSEHGSNDDDEDNGSDAEESDSDDEEEPGRNEYEGFKGAKVNNNLRYEVLGWWHHVFSALASSTEQERVEDPLWQELWTLLEQFMCRSPKVFRKWQELMWQCETCFLFSRNDDYLPPIHVAAAFNLTWVVKKLLERGEPIDGQSELKLLPLHTATWIEAPFLPIQPELLELLLNGNDPNYEGSPDYNPPFHWWVETHPTADIVKAMLAHGADAKMINKRGDHCLHWFAHEGEDVEALKMLIDAGADINGQRADGETPLHELLSRHDVPTSIVEAFLENGADVNAEDKDSQMPLYEAAIEGNLQIIELLLRHGADYKDTDTNGWTSLHGTARFGHPKCAKALIDAGAELTALTVPKNTPFAIACCYGQEDTALLLLDAVIEAKASVELINSRDVEGKSALRRAAAKGMLSVVQKLTPLLTKEDLNFQDSVNKRTALHSAAANGHAEVVAHFLEAGCDSTIKDRRGRTPLALCQSRWAVSNSDAMGKTLMLLIKHDIAYALQEQNLMADAAMKGDVAVLKALLDAGAKPDVKDQHDWTPMQLAQHYHHDESYELLNEATAAQGARPSAWVVSNPIVGLQEDGSLKWQGKGKSSVLTDHPIPSFYKQYYYEISLDDRDDTDGQSVFVAMGFTNEPRRLIGWAPGWEQNNIRSWGYHGDDGYAACHKDDITKYQQMFSHGDTVGCGVDFESGTIFWTKNGFCFGEFSTNAAGRLYPIVCLTEPSTIRVNFGNDVKSKPFVWAPANEGSFKDKIHDQREDEVSDDDDEEEQEEKEDKDQTDEEEKKKNENAEQAQAGAIESKLTRTATI